MSTLFDLPFEEPEPDPEPAAPPSPSPSPSLAPAPSRVVLSVSELTASLRQVLETTFAEVWVEGELSNAKIWNTGQLYITLKDGAAQIKPAQKSGMEHAMIERRIAGILPPKKG